MRPLPARALLWSAIGAYAVGFSALSALRHRAFNTGRFDLGNMVQAVDATAHGRVLEVTGLRGDQISRLAAHVDPILVVLAPLWRLWPSPDLLLIVQAIAVALGAIPVFRLARRRLGRDEQRALAVDEQLARRRCVGGDERRPAGERLKGLVRDHAGSLRGRPEDAERATRALDLLRQLFVLDPLNPLDVGRPIRE